MQKYKIYKGFPKIIKEKYPHVFSIFFLRQASLGKNGFRVYNPEVQTLLYTPISIAWITYGVYGNYGPIPNMAIMTILL